MGDWTEVVPLGDRLQASRTATVVGRRGKWLAARASRASRALASRLLRRPPSRIGPRQPGVWLTFVAAAVLGSWITVSARGRAAERSYSSRGGSIPAKVYRYAERVVAKYDRDGSGKLEKAEWTALAGDPSAADTDSNDILTVEEIAAYVAAYARRHPIRSVLPRAAAVATPSIKRNDSEATSGKKGATSRSARPERGKRFYVPATLLPAKLPPWFRARDRDGDGQLTLAEYAPSLSESAVREFARYDRNHDGLLVPDEVTRGPRPRQEGPQEKSGDAASSPQSHGSPEAEEAQQSEDSAKPMEEGPKPVGAASRSESDRARRPQRPPKSASDKHSRELDRVRRRQLELKRRRKERKKSRPEKDKTKSAKEKKSRS